MNLRYFYRANDSLLEIGHHVKWWQNSIKEFGKLPEIIELRKTSEVKLISIKKAKKVSR